MDRFCQSHRAERRAGHERGQAGGEPPDIHRMKSIDILARIDGVEHGAGIDLLGQRKLHQDAMHILVGIEFRDQRHQIRLRHVLRQLVIERSHRGIDNGFRFRADIDFARRIVAREHHGKSWHKAVLAFQVSRRAGDFRAQVLRDRFPVDDRC